MRPVVAIRFFDFNSSMPRGLLESSHIDSTCHIRFFPGDLGRKLFFIFHWLQTGENASKISPMIIQQPILVIFGSETSNEMDVVFP